MSYLNNPAVSNRMATPISVETEDATLEADEKVSAKLTQLTNFIKDHFVNGGKLGVSFAIAATRIAHGYAQATTDALTARLPEMQKHMGELPSALRAAIVTGGDIETRDFLRSQISALSQDASLAARTGALWGATGLAYAALPLTVAAGYALGATLGEERANQMIMEAMDNNDNETMEATIASQPEPAAVDG